MEAISRPAILQITTAAVVPYGTLAHATRGLIRAGRWPDRSRRDLLASDLASILNTLIGGRFNDAVEADDLLRGCDYVSSSPFVGPAKIEPQVPRFGERNWGRLLELLIESVASLEDAFPPRLIEWPEPNEIVSVMPNLIEGCLNPLGIDLVWHSPDGLVSRIDHYRPTTVELRKRAHPNGVANGLVRKSFLAPTMIYTAGQILRDSASRSSAKPASPSDTAVPNAVQEDEDAGTLPREPAPTRDQDRDDDPGDAQSGGYDARPGYSTCNRESTLYGPPN